MQLFYANKNNNYTSKFRLKITGDHILVDVTKEFDVFKRAFIGFFKNENNIVLSDETVKKIFLESISLFHGRVEASFHHNDVIGMLDNILSMDLTTDEYFDFSDILSYDESIEGVITDIVESNINLDMVDYIVYKDYIKICYIEKESDSMKERGVPNEERKIIDVPDELSVLVSLYNLNIKNINNLMFLNSLLDVANDVLMTDGHLDIHDRISRILISHNVSNMYNELFMLNDTAENMGLCNGLVSSFMEGLLEHDGIYNLNDYKIIMSDILNRKIFLTIIRR